MVNRRRVLQLGSVTGLAALTGCNFLGRERSTPGERTPGNAATEDSTSDPPGRRSPSYGGRFENSVNIIDDAGADPEGGDSIIPVLRDQVADDTLLYFPPGRYYMAGLWELPDFSNVAFVGDDATIVPPEGYEGYLFAIGSERHRPSGVLFEGFHFDFRNEATAPRPIQITASNELYVRDVSVEGTGRVCRFDVLDRDGTGLVERLRLPDGGHDSAGCFVGPITEGTISFVDCFIAGFRDNGLYASPSKGPVRVTGGSYRNNGIANVRVSGDSVVRRVHVRCDESPDSFRNMRGIRLRHGKSALVEDCLIEMLDVTYSDGAIVLGSRMESAVVRNTDVRIGADDVAAVKAKSPTDSIRRSSTPRFRCRDLRITGGGDGYSAVLIVDREDCLLERVCISQHGRNRHGIHLIRTEGTVVRDSRISVSGTPIRLKQASPTLENVVTSEDLRAGAPRGEALCSPGVESL